MIKKLDIKSTACAAVVTLGVSLSGNAAYADGHDKGMYVSALGGLTSIMDAGVTTNSSTANATGTFQFDTGSVLSGAVGKSFDNLRLEGEVSYRSNDIDRASGVNGTVGGSLFTTTGDILYDAKISTLAFMANGFYDFKAATKVTPYVMGGLGFARVNLDIDSVAGVNSSYEDTDTVLAWQAGVGMSYEVSPKIDFHGTYRIFGAVSPEFESGGEKVEGGSYVHNIMLGLAYKF